MHDLSATWTAFAGVAIVLTAMAAVGAVIAVGKLWRIRVDSRVIEAAERLERVNLSRVVKRYVPAELQSQKFVEEIAVAKQLISARRPRWKRAAVASGAIMLCGAAAASLAIHEDLKAVGTARLAAKPTANVDALKDIQGVWGWKADFLQSCSENPQTISVAPDRKTLTVQYAKPYQNGRQTTTKLDFDVVSAAPDTLVLSGSDSARPSAVRTYFKFIDANAFTLIRSNHPFGSSGTIARCQSRPAGASAAN